jgi:hypothetical protein
MSDYSPTNTPTDTNNSSVVISADTVLEIKRSEFEKAKAAYDLAKKDFDDKEARADKYSDYLYECESQYDELVEKRENKNQELRDKRKEIDNISKVLQASKAGLARLELLAKDIRQAAIQAKKKLDKAVETSDILDEQRDDAELDLDDAFDTLKAAQEAYRAVGGISPTDVVPEPKVESQVIEKGNEKNPWKTGSFYLVSAIIVIITFAVISANLPWYAVGIVFIGGILTLSVIAALQLRTDESLSEENFLKLMIETFKRLPLLKSDKAPKSDENSSQEKQ